MIIYFSATGNSKYVAKRIAEATNDFTRSIATFEYGEFIELKKDKMLGIVCPTYFYGLPVNVEEYIRKVKMLIDPSVYCYFVTTYGGETGHPETFVEDALKAKGVRLDASYRVRMPENFTPMFSVNDKDAIAKVLEEAEPIIDGVIAHIRNRDKGCFIDSTETKNAEVHKKYDEMRKTSNFTVSDACIGCMLCAKRCPSKAIQMQDKKPVWVKDMCTLCLGCLHRCPQNAIDYAGMAKDNGQYRNPHDVTWEN